MTLWIAPPPILNFPRRRFSSPLLSSVLNAESEGDLGEHQIQYAAASSPHQIQPDPQIDVRAYAPDRILEWTFPPSPGRALHHLSSLWKDMGKR